jgi:hypothetical protein
MSRRPETCAQASKRFEKPSCQCMGLPWMACRGGPEMGALHLTCHLVEPSSYGTKTAQSWGLHRACYLITGYWLE